MLSLFLFQEVRSRVRHSAKPFKTKMPSFVGRAFIGLRRGRDYLRDPVGGGLQSPMRVRYAHSFLFKEGLLEWGTRTNPFKQKRLRQSLRRMQVDWRRGRDSNPRYAFTYTHFPGVLVRPL